MRTYLYVDGENFAIRARELHAKLAAAPDERRELLVDLKTASSWDPSKFSAQRWGAAEWMPRPHRSMVDSLRAKGGILYTRDEIYWDPPGLFIAFMHGLPETGDIERATVPIDKAYYYAGATGVRIEQHKADLHALGFSPHVLPRVKPDAWAKEMGALGITVVSRPKPIDILIATQVLDDCASNNFDRCIFVGGDADYVPLLETVRRRGKQVWLVAFERWLDKASALRFACDRFFAYDAVLAARGLPPDPPQPSA